MPRSFVVPEFLRAIPRTKLSDASRYWEPRRLPYNLLLAALFAAWLVATWPAFRGAFTPAHVGQLALLALLANVCYSAAYVVELGVEATPARNGWRERRWLLWATGTLFALLIEYYWIGDEIYPRLGGH
jgi:hypothetical protein